MFFKSSALKVTLYSLPGFRFCSCALSLNWPLVRTSALAALLTLALAAGFKLPDAAEIANHASGIVVGKLGTATLTPDELLAAFS